MKKALYQNIYNDNNLNAHNKVLIIANMGVVAQGEAEMQDVLTWHEQLELLHFHEGGAEVFYGTARAMAQDGDIFVINPLEPHTVKFYKKRPVYDCVMIERIAYHELIRDLCLLQYGAPMPDQNVCFHSLFHSDATLAYLLDMIVREFADKKFAYDAAINSYVQNLIVELFRAGSLTFKPIKDNEWTVLNYQRMEPALRYLEDNYAKQVCLDKLAAQCAITKSYFCRLFKKATGKTVTEYVTSLRLSLANRLLQSTDLPIAEIARQAGFDDNCYFSRKYRKEYGFPPNKNR